MYCSLLYQSLTTSVFHRLDDDNDDNQTNSLLLLLLLLLLIIIIIIIIIIISWHNSRKSDYRDAHKHK